MSQDKIKENLLLKKNILFFSLLKACDILFPLILQPILILKLGVLDYGYYMIMVAIVSLMRLVINFGFEWGASRKILLVSNDLMEMSRVFHSVFLAKIFILTVLSICISISYYLVGWRFFEEQYFWACLLLLLALLGEEILYSAWFYMSMQKAHFISIIKSFHRLLLILCFVGISSYYPPFWVIISLEIVFSLLFGSVSFFLIVRNFHIPISMWVSMKDIFLSFKENYQIFLSNFSVYMYSSINTLLIGAMLGGYSAGIYAICERLYMALRVILEPVVQAFYPYLVKLYVANKNKFYTVFNKLLLYLFSFLCLEAIFAFLFSQEILHYLNSERIVESEQLFKIYAFILPLALGGILSKYLIIVNKAKVLLKITFISMIINLIISPIFIYFIGVIGAVLAFSIIQIFQVSCQLYIYFRDKKNAF